LHDYHIQCPIRDEPPYSLLGEYLGRLFLTANRKPQFVVRDVERNERALGDRPELVVHDIELGDRAAGDSP
jgi:hypothetical protein